MITQTTKILVVLLFTGVLVSASEEYYDSFESFSPKTSKAEQTNILNPLREDTADSFIPTIQEGSELSIKQDREKFIFNKENNKETIDSEDYHDSFESFSPKTSKAEQTNILNPLREDANSFILKMQEESNFSLKQDSEEFSSDEENNKNPITKQTREKRRMENGFKKIATGLFEHEETKQIIFESKDKSWGEKQSLYSELYNFNSWSFTTGRLKKYIKERDWDNLFYMIAWDEHRGFMDELMESLAEVIDVNEREYDGMTDGIGCWKNRPIDKKQTTTALVRAAPSASLKTIETLLNRKANVNYQEPKYGWTALHWAAREVDMNWEDGDLGVFKLLLSRGAKLELKSKNGYTVYQHAHIEPLKKLIKSWRWNQLKYLWKIRSDHSDANLSKILGAIKI